MPPRASVTIDWDVDGHRQLVDESELASLMRHGLGVESRTGSWEFAIRFVSDAEMSRLHEIYLNDPSPTDIMTFPYDAGDGEQGGDILISVDMAATNASGHGWRTSEEIRFLMLHGLLHILGWDDHAAEDRAAMLQRQHELLSSWQGQREINR